MLGELRESGAAALALDARDFDPLQFARQGIRANAILPGLMETPMAIDTRVRATGKSRAQIIAELQSKPEVQVHVYPGCDHAFARNAGVHFDADAAQLANSRTAEFFAAQLK